MFLQLSQLLDDEAVEINYKTGTMKTSEINPSMVGSLLVQVVEYNLNQLYQNNDITANNQKIPKHFLENAKAARDCAKETLAIWHHAITKRYNLLPWTTSNKNVPSCLEGIDGCLRCGRFIKLKRCSRCKLAKYCCREHQVMDYKAGHKALCRAAVV